MQVLHVRVETISFVAYIVGTTREIESERDRGRVV